ncbi:MAG: T9SS type A sorting domain-containing protein, partial [Flavobacteriaceae bacterium]|nr:T9SS type A sorting domain-containing protein [Flavobacteriaceae bacterium]
EWLWLSVGASFADGDFQNQPIGTLSDALVDYVRVYKSSETLGARKSRLERAFYLYPNPAKHSVHIKTNEPNYTLDIYDLNGRQ